MRATGVEPAWPCGHGILSPARLPVPPRPRWGMVGVHEARAILRKGSATLRQRRSPEAEEKGLGLVGLERIPARAGRGEAGHDASARSRGVESSAAPVAGDARHHL